jgi:hypothetical protein
MNTLTKLIFHPTVGLSIPAPSPALDLDQMLPNQLRLREALRLKSVELWLRLDLPEMASRELEALPAWADRHPWTLRMHMLVWSALALD